ncbi:MAG TPA: glutamate-cysteine ligase family protein [Burkholderiales bacterium]|nr:glutamate-cysteine ligase family protein [Burkholderiales bacterium]
MAPKALHAFAGAGIELEYVLVDRETLAVRPIADQLLRDASGAVVNALNHGRFGWSNELVLHLLELKSERPEAGLESLAEGFQDEVRAMNARLAPLGARLMPTGMHPWMNPRSETRLWPHEYAEIYATYDRVFDCRRHGWANVQSMHVNLPFAGDAELARLLAAARRVLPILPALAASSPVADGARQTVLDYRMQCYLTHAARVPAMLGDIVPEPVRSEAAYRAEILAPMYAEMAPFDADGVMQDEWLNARGAIVRFDRSALELRVIDTQECPAMDLAVAAAAIGALRACYEGRLANEDPLAPFPTARLVNILHACIADADAAIIDDAEYLTGLGLRARRATAGELWRHLIETTLSLVGSDEERTLWNERLELILSEGPLARRILQAAGSELPRERLQAVYAELCDCLEAGRPFSAEA